MVDTYREDGFPSIPSIGSAAESILCVGVFDDKNEKNDQDYEVFHKFTASNLPMPVLGGELEFHVTPFPTEKTDQFENQIKYSRKLFGINVELETDHTFGPETKISITNDTLLRNAEFKVESMRGNLENDFEHRFEANYTQGAFLKIFNGSFLRASYDTASRIAEAEVALHTDITSLSVCAAHDVSNKSTSYSSMAELRGDTCTLSIKHEPNAEAEVERTVAALHTQLTPSTGVALSANGSRDWLVGIKTDIDDCTSIKLRLGAKGESREKTLSNNRRQSGGNDTKQIQTTLDCAIAKNVRPDLRVVVTSAINTQKLSALTAHRFGIKALFEM